MSSWRGHTAKQNAHRHRQDTKDAAARLKDNPLNGNVIGISEDFAQRTQQRRQELVPYRKFLKKNLATAGKSTSHILQY